MSRLFPRGNPGDYQGYIYGLVRKFKPLKCIEIGLHIGNSTEAIVRALIKNGKGSLISIDNLPCPEGHERVNRLRGVSAIWQVTNESSGGAFSDELVAGTDFLYIDGDHSESAVQWDWDHYGVASKVVLFDDYHAVGPQGVVDRLWSSGIYVVELHEYDWGHMQALVRRR